MAKKEKEVKTNAMRILEKLKIPFEVKTYECDEFVAVSYTHLDVYKRQRLDLKT